MINIRKLFAEMPSNILDNQRRVDVEAKIKIYYGYSKEGLLRISFLSSCRPFIIDSTKLIRVLQVNESENVFWTCFDLLDISAESVYYSLIEDLIFSIRDCIDEIGCLKKIKNRFAIWKKLLGRKNTNEMPEEKVKGLLGELYFLYKYMIPQFGVNDAIVAWGGPDDNSKDFTINDKWYEIKTVSLNVNEVKISSVVQLDSDVDGKLAIIRIENMSGAYSDGLSCLEEIVSSILDKTNDFSIKEIFLSKLEKLKYSPIDNAVKMKFKIHSMDLYLVNRDFPRICSANIPFSEICRLTYSIYIKAIERFKEAN